MILIIPLNSTRESFIGKAVPSTVHNKGVLCLYAHMKCISKVMIHYFSILSQESYIRPAVPLTVNNKGVLCLYAHMMFRITWFIGVLYRESSSLDCTQWRCRMFIYSYTVYNKINHIVPLNSNKEVLYREKSSIDCIH